jgi:hypothetical protein
MIAKALVVQTICGAAEVLRAIRYSVTVAGQLAEGKQSPGVVGRFKAGSALAILLKDTRCAMTW